MQSKTADAAILECPGHHHRNDEIEVLRAVGVLLVIFEHINTLIFWRTTNFEGFVNLYGGVDLFFCISGFVITSAFGEEIAKSTATPHLYWRTVAAFWIRRFYRITPLAWTVLFINVIVFLVFYDLDLPSFVGDFLSIAFDVENFHYAYCTLKTASLCGPNGVYWSISLEEQFYLLFPILFLLPRRYMVLGLLATAFTFIWLPRTTLVWMIRLDTIALGVLLALIRTTEAYRSLQPKFLASRAFRWPVVSILMMGLGVMPAGSGLVPFFPTMVSLIALLLVFVASYDLGYLCRPGWLRSTFVWIGQRSFALYLMHNTAFWVVRGLQNDIFPNLVPGRGPAVGLIVASAILLAVGSDLSFRFLETPLRRRGRKVAAEFLLKGEVPLDDIHRAEVKIVEASSRGH